MKKLRSKSWVALLCLSTGMMLSGQDTITVEPGVGTLETAILEHGGEVVYKLSAGAKYELEKLRQKVKVASDDEEVASDDLGGEEPAADEPAEEPAEEPEV